MIALLLGHNDHLHPTLYRLSYSIHHHNVTTTSSSMVEKAVWKSRQLKGSLSQPADFAQGCPRHCVSRAHSDVPPSPLFVCSSVHMTKNLHEAYLWVLRWGWLVFFHLFFLPPPRSCLCSFFLSWKPLLTFFSRITRLHLTYELSALSNVFYFSILVQNQVWAGRKELAPPSH